MKKLSNSLNEYEMDVWRKYHKRSCGAYTRCKIDQVCLDVKTTTAHKLGILDKAREHIVEGKHFITEAVPNDRPSRRIDFVSLTEDVEYEFETNPKVKKNGAETVYVKEA
jgi:hypothetical protein